ncbi:MAG: type I-U CRISPR-associated protein Csx17 [bacterium]|nr:type I-U CRISPR-associated protein Csx17 [bacterium]
MHDLHLPGLSPTPIARYLAALGLLRLVAEQHDPDARALWSSDTFVLRSTLDADALRRFLLETYRPSPVIAPWNGGSGFYPKDNRAALDAIRKGNAARFALVRDVIAAGRAVVKRFALGASPKAEDKAAFLAAIRATFPDDALPWIDAAVLLGADDPRYPPLLGTGGNDGRLDFTNNFLQRLVELFDPAMGVARPDAAAWLEGSLFGTPIPGLVSCAIGQFAPGAAGGPNATNGFEGGSIVNPWDFVLALEGSLLLTAAATRRLESAAGGALSYPFTVRPTGAGSGAADVADEQPARGEIWLPIWTRPATYREIAALFREGRATVGRRTAADGFDFRRAVASLGVDRGIDAFARYAFAMRSGRSFLATPLGRVRVRREAESDLLVDLDRDGYLETLRQAARRDECPAALASHVRRLENAVFAMLGRATPRRLAVQNVLVCLGAIERAAGASRFARETARIRPVPWLSEGWAIAADDGSHELRLAAALAGAWGWPCPFRAHVAPVGPSDRRGWEAPEWEPGSALATFGDTIESLAATLDRRLLSAETAAAPPAIDPLDGRCRADAAALAAFVRCDVDLARLCDLAAGLALVRMPATLGRREESAGATAGTSAALAALVTAFSPPALLSHLKLLPVGATLPRPRRVVALLRAGRTGGAVALAWRTLRLAGMPLPEPAPDAVESDGARLAAALLFALEPASVAELARRLVEPIDPASEPPTKGSPA